MAESQATTSEPTPSEMVPYKQGPDYTLNLHVFLPEKSGRQELRPAMVFFFGGGWVRGTPSQFYPFCQRLANRGMVAFSAEYRVEQTHGTPPTACVEDGKSAMRWVRQNARRWNIDPERIAAGGGSAGGHVAAATAFLDGYNDPQDDLSISCQPSALVLFNPVIDNSPDGYGSERAPDHWESFSPLHNIGDHAPPTLFMLGTEDQLVPVSTGQAFCQKIRAAGARCQLELYEGAAHAFFNYGRPGGFYEQTAAAMEGFLFRLGYLEP